jgi:hypothetical protein
MVEIASVLPVAGAIAGEKHVPVVLLGAGDPRTGAHARAYRDCVLGVLLGWLPALRRRRERAEIPGYGRARPISGFFGLASASSRHPMRALGGATKRTK